MSGIPLGNVYDKYHTRNPVARAIVQNFLDRAAELASSVHAATVLEVGCGEGHLSERLAGWCQGARVYGVDLADSLFDASVRSKPCLFFSAQSAYQMAFPSSAFDLVVGCEVLEHLDRPEQALAEIRRVARRHVLLSVPREPLWRVLNVARGAYWRDWGNTPGHVQHWSRDEFLAIVSRHFTLTRVVAPLPWTMVLAEKK